MYNNAWYYGNQSNEPALVSTSKEINLIQATSSTSTGIFTATDTAPFSINFSSRADYYTFPIQYWNFSNLSTSTITSYTANQNKRLGINIGGQNSIFSFITFDSSNTCTNLSRRLLMMPTHIGNSDYNCLLYSTNSQADNYSSTSDFTNVRIEEYGLSSPSAFTPIISGTSVTCRSISIMWYGAKFEY